MIGEWCANDPRFTIHRSPFTFLPLLRWHTLRDLARHRLLALLNVLSIALGIAVYLAIRIANDSANASFAAGVDLIAGKAHLEIRGEIDETLLPKIARAPGVKAATPLVEGVVTLPDWPGEYLRIVGVDLFTNEPFRAFELRQARRKNFDFEKWLGAPGIALTKEFADRHRIAEGNRLRVLANSVSRELPVVALIDAGDSPAGAQSRFAAMDIGWAQELFATQGRLASISLLLDAPGRMPQIAQTLRSHLPDHLTIEPPRQRSFQMQQMLSAFRLNLTALSMVSLLVGAFLIYNTVSASVARRRTEIGILRALGATRLEVRAPFLGEALLFGLLGIAAGAIGGVLLAQGLVGAVGKTISSLYLLVSIEQTHMGATQFALVAALGLGAVLVGAWMPADEAARIDPIAALSLGTRMESAAARAQWLHWLGLAFLAAALVASWYALRGGPAAMSFAAAFCVLAGFALFAPGATLLFARASGALARGAILARLGADNLRRAVHRNGVTVAALASAVAMMAGLTIMIFSFRSSVSAWVEHGVVADLFIAPSSNETIGLNAFVPPAAIAWLRARPEIAAVDTFRELPVAFSRNSSAPGDALLGVVGGAYRHNMTFAGGDEERKMARVFAGEAIAVTESFSRKFDIREDDRISLRTPRGPAEIEVAGVYRDYTRDQGVIFIARPLFEKYWDDARVQSLAIYLAPGANSERVSEGFRAQFSRAGEFVTYSNQALRRRILAIFDQTFAVTSVLRTVAVVVALAGVFLSVTTLVSERAREVGVLRAIGASRGQIEWMLIVESALIALLACLLGLVAGSILAMVLTWVVNPAFFGWTIALQFPWPTLLATPIWIVPAALAAAWLPAHRAASAPIAVAVREE